MRLVFVTTLILSIFHTNNAQSASSFVGNCMQHNWEAAGNKQNLVCRAKEVTVENVRAKFDGECIQGEMTTVTLIGDVHFNAERYDPGWYIATDGGNGLTGKCAIQSLSKGGHYSFTNNGEVRWDKDEGTDKNAAGDLCGDILIKGGKGTTMTSELAVDVPVLCNDSNSTGTLEVAICFSWFQKGKDSVCKPKALYPGSTSKCACAYHEVPNVLVHNELLQELVVPMSLYPEPEGGEEVPSVDASDGAIRAGDKNCLNDVNWDAFVSDIVCAAGEVEVDEASITASITASPAGQCTAGENITITLNADINMLSGRSDPAWYVATDGGDALTGFCQAQYLQEETQYTLTNGATVLYDQDVCGDIESTGATTMTGVDLLHDHEVLCIDDDGDGFLDIAVCFAWDNNASGFCQANQPNIGSFTECDCERLKVEDIRVVQPILADTPAYPKC